MIEIRPARPDELREALGLVLSRPGVNVATLRAQVDAFLTHGQVTPPSSQPTWVVVEGGSLVTAVACLDTPGRASLVFLPAVTHHDPGMPLIYQVLHAVVQAGRQRGTRLFQAFVSPGSNIEGYVLATAGFDPLAELVYLERPVPLPLSSIEVPDGLTWICYSPTTHALFAHVIQATYQRSLDCPRLSGLRDIEDVIASHKGTGLFDAGKWLVLHQAAEPVGCLLLANLPHRSAMELVYMGLLPGFRGRGLGRAMLYHAIQAAIRDRVAYVTLAVDRNNLPAYRLYGHFGFNETMRREAWILSGQPTER